jgi:hypothetical protein
MCTEARGACERKYIEWYISDGIELKDTCHGNVIIGQPVKYVSPMMPAYAIGKHNEGLNTDGNRWIH